MAPDDLLQSLNSDDAQQPIPLQRQAQAALLLEFHQLLEEKHTFKVGDLVEWKHPQFANRQLPAPLGLAVVTEVLATPIGKDQTNIASTYSTEAMDMVIGIIHPDGDFLTFYAHSPRFKPAVLPQKRRALKISG
jgi:hypothetical protein